MNDIKVLIVDDEADFATSLTERLLLRNFSCRVSNSGMEALRKIQEGIPDVVVLDLKMPDMSGLEVLAEIKRKNPKIQVIMLTGHGSISNGLKGMEEGAFDYLMKPFDINELVLKIKSAAQKSKAGGGNT